jgi:uncharacterized protein YbjT (DUF2867 family)
MFAANTVAWWAPQIRAGDVVRWPYGAVGTAPIDERDIAAVAARALSEASLAGGDYVLTGPVALNHARQVAVIGQVLGRRLASTSSRRPSSAATPPSAGRGPLSTCCSPPGPRRSGIPRT